MMNGDEMMEEGENNFDGDDGWEQDDDPDGEGNGWDEYDNEEDDLPDVVKQALE